MKRNSWARLVLGLLLAFWLPVIAAGTPVGEVRLLGKTATPTPSPTAIPVSVLSPQAGQAVQGVVPVTAYTQVDGFLSSELYFGYSADTTGTWFLIARQDTRLDGALFASWDTTTITDGNYNLRLVVTIQDQTPIIYLVEALRVRNYSPVETDTPTPSPTSQPGNLPTQTPSPLPTLTPLPPTPTPLPTNPAVLNGGRFGRSAGAGILGALAAFLLLGLYLAVRQGPRRKERN